MQEHGKYKIVRNGNVIHSYFDYAINLECSIAYFKKLKKTVQDIENWVSYVHTTTNSMGTPDSISYSTELNLQLPSWGCAACVIHVSNIMVDDFSEKTQMVSSIPFLSSKNETELNDFIQLFTESQSN